MRVEDISKYYLDLILPVFLIILAELLIFFGHMKAALAIHSLNLMLLIFSSVYIVNRVYPALMLLPLFRLLNIAMPVFFQLTLYSYPLVYAPMFLPIYLILKERMFSRSEIGITAKGFWFFLPLAVAVGFALGWGEYQVLRPGVLIPDFSLRSVLTLSLTMILFVGLVEEFVFRSALQTVMEERLGSIVGLVVTSVLFGFMHSGYQIPLELFYVSFAGIVFGLLFWLTKSLPIIALAHGVTNVSLFLVAPAFSDLLIYIIAISGLIFVIIASISRRLPGGAGGALIPQFGRTRER
ncbi:MAG: type II CAAX endopeptidase family protein [Methanotrichaceae archaeon]|nr:type II CAAX endopeptidase family protein [Methanotrichaceae archaeon]